MALHLLLSRNSRYVCDFLCLCGAVALDLGTDVLTGSGIEGRHGGHKALVTITNQMALGLVGEVTLIVDLTQCLGHLHPVDDTKIRQVVLIVAIIIIMNVQQNKTIYNKTSN